MFPEMVAESGPAVEIAARRACARCDRVASGDARLCVSWFSFSFLPLSVVPHVYCDIHRLAQPGRGAAATADDIPLSERHAAMWALSASAYEPDMFVLIAKWARTELWCNFAHLVFLSLSSFLIAAIASSPIFTSSSSHARWSPSSSFRTCFDLSNKN